MAYILQGKILDAEGFKFEGTAEIEEVGTSGVVMSSAWSNPDTGAYTISVQNPNSLVRVTAFGHKTVTYPASQMPTTLTLQPNIEVTGSVTLPKSNAIWIALGLVAVAVGYSVATGSQRGVATTNTVKSTKRKPLPVVV